MLLFLITPLLADELTVDPPLIWDAVCRPCRPPDPPPFPICDFEQNVVVDLTDPLYEDGVLTTESGGVLTAPGLRIQAQKITYIRKPDADPPVFTVQCEGNLLIDYEEWALVGDSLYYDFLTHRGFLINGRTASPPWIIGGREILLMDKGELIVLDGLVTTSEGEVDDVMLCAARICLTPDRILSATNIQVRLNQIPVFWFPKFQLDLKNIGRSPFAVRFGWGGFKGSYLSVLYRFLSWEDFKATARLDAFFTKGIGAGIETVYNPSWRPTQWYSRNYYAYDLPIDDPERKKRYRFQGTFYDKYYGVTVNGLYDIVSDGQMAADYTTRDFDLPTAGRTELELRRKGSAWIANFFTRVRVNHFQSVNQELPSFQLNWHPFEIGRTGIICQNLFQASYLDYVFSDEIPNRSDFASSRVAVHPFLYRPLFFGPFTVTPEAGLIAIAYGNTPSRHSAGQALGEFGVRLETALSRCSNSWKHVVEPYLHYHHLTAPRVATDRHFIFTIDDGLDRLNLLRFGVRQSFFTKTSCGIERFLWLDLWANAFFATHTIPQTIPRGYLNLEWLAFTRLLCTVQGGWLFQENELDFCNTRLEWTLNPSLAFAVEWRHRSRFDWRKADFYNFILESVRTQQELLNSDLSDRRDTLLFRIFSRFTPDWTAELDVRHGWRKEPQGTYFEYEIEISRILFQHWRMTFDYERRESDNRFSFSILLDPGPPPRGKGCCWPTPKVRGYI